MSDTTATPVASARDRRDARLAAWLAQGVREGHVDASDALRVLRHELRRRNTNKKTGILRRSEAAHAVVREAKAAGVLVFAGGVMDPAQTTVVGRDGRATAGPNATRAEFIAGLTIVDVSTRDEALAWAARIAAACRCAQELREFGAGSLTLAD